MIHITKHTHKKRGWVLSATKRRALWHTSWPRAWLPMLLDHRTSLLVGCPKTEDEQQRAPEIIRLLFEEQPQKQPRF